MSISVHSNIIHNLCVKTYTNIIGILLLVRILNVLNTQFVLLTADNRPLHQSKKSELSGHQI